MMPKLGLLREMGPKPPRGQPMMLRKRRTKRRSGGLAGALRAKKTVLQMGQS